MSEKGQIFRALVTERLTAAAEEIFALFERTIAEYEEELCRSKEENQRNQKNQRNPRLLQTVAAEGLRSPGSEANVPRPHALSGVKVKSAAEEKEEEEEDDCRGYDENNTQTTIIKEEYIKQEEEEQLQDFSFFSRKNDEDGDQTDHEEDWEAPCSSSFQHGEAEPEVDYFSQVYMQALEQNPNRTPAMRQPKCPECDQEFDLKEDLQTHMLEVHGGDKHISCPVCGRTFTRNGSLKLHMAMHMHEKPYSCPVCNRGFTQKGNLRSHMAQHTGEKPFSCSECDARFPIKRTLLRHMKLHTGERPYSCPYCEKSFTRKEHVRLHMAVHTGQATPKKRRVMPTRSERDGADTSNDSSGAGLYGGGANE